jgi:hypothetical protein
VQFRLRLDPARLITMLCIALAMVFAGASLSRNVDRLQHGPGGSPIHEHLLFSDISLDDGHSHDFDHDQSGYDDDDSSEPFTGGHHHHGDLGSGLILLASHDWSVPALRGDRHNQVPEPREAGFRILGPERPPKTSTISA